MHTIMDYGGQAFGSVISRVLSVDALASRLCALRLGYRRVYPCATMCIRIVHPDVQCVRCAGRMRSLRGR